MTNPIGVFLIVIGMILGIAGLWLWLGNNGDETDETNENNANLNFMVIKPH